MIFRLLVFAQTCRLKESVEFTVIMTVQLPTELENYSPSLIMIGTIVVYAVGLLLPPKNGVTTVCLNRVAEKSLLSASSMRFV